MRGVYPRSLIAALRRPRGRWGALGSQAGVPPGARGFGEFREPRLSVLEQKEVKKGVQELSFLGNLRKTYLK